MNPGHYTYVDPSATPFVYTDDYSALSKDKPAGHAHIINTAGFDETSKDQYKLRAADGIATYLFKIEPAALTALLDLDQPSFVFHEKKTKTFSGCHIFVFREDRKITAGYATKDPPVWDLRVSYNLSDSGEWEPVECYRWLMGRGDQGGKVEMEGHHLAMTLLTDGLSDDRHEVEWSSDKDVLEMEKRGIDPTEKDETTAFLDIFGTCH